MLNDEIVKSGNFTQSNYTVPDIVSKYSSILKEKHNISFKQSNLPFIYWIPKFHKYPVDFRFITSGKNTVINTLSKFIDICIKHFLDVEGHHCKLVHKFDGIKDYYIIDNNKEVIQFMKESNCLNNYDKNIKTYDFKTLYTKIPHNKLKTNIKTFISMLFGYKKRKYINISSKRKYINISSKRKYINISSKRKYINISSKRKYINISSKRKYINISSKRKYINISSKRKIIHQY